MIGSTGRRWKFTRIAGAGLVCLGAGSLIVSGCSTATVSDSRASAKSGEQVAGSRSKSAGKTTLSAKTSAPQVAAKGPPGKVRISDLDGDTRVEMAARVGQSPVPGNAQPVKTTPIPSAAQAEALARNAPPPTITPAQDRQQVARRTATPKAVQQRTAPAGSSQSSSTNAVAAKTRAPSGTIRQTAGANQSRAASSTRPATKSADLRPVITPRKSEWQPENGGETVASIHERKRADRLMQRAYAMYESGYREEALRLASVAAELENSQLAAYKRGEERPSDFVEFLLTASTRNNAATIETAPPAPAAATGSTTDRSASRAGRKIAGGVLPTYGTNQPQAPRDLNPPAPGAPCFTRDDGAAPNAAANAGQVQVPVAKSCRNADVSVVTAEGDGASAGDSRTVVTADRIDEAGTTTPAPREMTSKDAETASAAALPATEETESLAEAENPAAATPQGTSQVTIASVVGLLTGIAGMLGLAWWRRQERQHYAGGK